MATNRYKKFSRHKPIECHDRFDSGLTQEQIDAKWERERAARRQSRILAEQNPIPIAPPIQSAEEKTPVIAPPQPVANPKPFKESWWTRLFGYPSVPETDGRWHINPMNGNIISTPPIRINPMTGNVEFKPGRYAKKS
jgi:hypothetical protein